MFRVRGVRMWVRDPHEGAADEAGGWRPMREVESLCGLALGGDDALEDREHVVSRPAHQRQKPGHLRLVTLDGCVANGTDQLTQLDRVDQGLKAKHPGRGR